MKIAILGAGFTGLTAAYRLAQKGHEVTIFEKENAVGGLAIGFKLPEWDWAIEKGYHHWFTNDDSVLKLAEEIHHKVIITKPSTDVLIDGNRVALDTPLTLLTFSALPLIDRLRMGLILTYLKLSGNQKKFVSTPALSWIRKCMAAPITHIVLTDIIFDKFFSDKDKDNFYIGTSFPDIRYLGVIDRQKTHFNDVNIEYLKSLPSFEAGLKLHSLVDKVRDDFVISRGVYASVPQSPFITHALKFFEDKMFYTKRSNWKSIASYFKNSTEDELSIGVAKAHVENWHKFLQTYFSSGPGDQNIYEFVSIIGKPTEMAEEIIRLTKSMGNNNDLKQIVADFYENFEDLLVVSN